MVNNIINNSTKTDNQKRETDSFDPEAREHYWVTTTVPSIEGWKEQ